MDNLKLNLALTQDFKIKNKTILAAPLEIAVQTNEIVGIIGPNGSGKTTLFSIIAAIHHLPKKIGTLKLREQEINSWSLGKRSQNGLAYLPQEASLFPELTVYDNLLATLQVCAKDNTTDFGRLIEEKINYFNLNDFALTLGRQLSGGQRRRAELARLCLTNNRILLLDEPFAGVDPIAAQHLATIIKKMAGDGYGIIITDHSVRLMLNSCDHLYVLIDGKIVMHGDRASVMQDEYVIRNYLGEDNQANDSITE